MSKELKIKINCNMIISDDPNAEDIFVDLCTETSDRSPVINVTFSKKYVMSFVES